jgi:hypothetical protein
MTSDRKAEANRQNALKSTGPKTLEGKTAVRLNAVKHGLLSDQVLLPDEDEDALIAGCNDIGLPRSSAHGPLSLRTCPKALIARSVAVQLHCNPL